MSRRISSALDVGRFEPSTEPMNIEHAHKRAAELLAGDVPAAKRPRPEMGGHDVGFGFGSQAMMIEGGGAAAEDGGGGGGWGCWQQQQLQLQKQQSQLQAASYDVDAGQCQWDYFESAAYEQADLMCMLPGMANNRYVCDPFGR